MRCVLSVLVFVMISGCAGSTYPCMSFSAPGVCVEFTGGYSEESARSICASAGGRPLEDWRCPASRAPVDGETGFQDEVARCHVRNGDGDSSSEVYYASFEQRTVVRERVMTQCRAEARPGAGSEFEFESTGP